MEYTLSVGCVFFVWMKYKMMLEIVLQWSNSPELSESLSPRLSYSLWLK